MCGRSPGLSNCTLSFPRLLTLTTSVRLIRAIHTVGFPITEPIAWDTPVGGDALELIAAACVWGWRTGTRLKHQQTPICYPSACISELVNCCHGEKALSVSYYGNISQFSWIFIQDSINTRCKFYLLEIPKSAQAGEHSWLFNKSETGSSLHSEFKDNLGKRWRFCPNNLSTLIRF